MVLTAYETIVISGTTSKNTEGKIGALELIGDYKSSGFFIVLLLAFLWPLMIILVPISVISELYNRTK